MMTPIFDRIQLTTTAGLIVRSDKICTFLQEPLDKILGDQPEGAQPPCQTLAMSKVANDEATGVNSGSFLASFPLQNLGPSSHAQRVPQDRSLKHQTEVNQSQMAKSLQEGWEHMQALVGRDNCEWKLITGVAIVCSAVHFVLDKQICSIFEAKRLVIYAQHLQQ